MEEKLYKGKKNGMLVLILTILLYAAAIGGIVFAAIELEKEFSVLMTVIMVIAIVWVAIIGWIPLCGLKVLRPQEALVLTLFGKYIGTLKGDGFYWVNPFCSSVNPAAKTRLSQSGDVRTTVSVVPNQITVSPEDLSKKISLKLMTLSNSRQKINDCLGNPIEIAIAVTWRIVDTAKAVFNVDNYKEYL